MPDGTDTEFNGILAKGRNQHFDALFPDCTPAEDAQRFDIMIERFKADTKLAVLDRNGARAHRKRSKDARVSFQTLEKVAEQVEVFKTYFRNVCMVPTGGIHTMDSVMFQWDWETTARDMADSSLASFCCTTPQTPKVKPILDRAWEHLGDFPPADSFAVTARTRSPSRLPTDRCFIWGLGWTKT
jgi:hypothetical protein